MNEKTAGHLNRLKALAVPATFEVEVGGGWAPPCRNIIRHPRREVGDRLREAAMEIAKGVWPKAVEIAIRQQAAKDACVNVQMWSDYAGLHYGGSDAGVECLRLCEAEVAAMIEADNLVRAKRYEDYRLACAQGVAVPPSDSD